MPAVTAAGRAFPCEPVRTRASVDHYAVRWACRPSTAPRSSHAHAAESPSPSARTWSRRGAPLRTVVSRSRAFVLGRSQRPNRVRFTQSARTGCDSFSRPASFGGGGAEFRTRHLGVAASRDARKSPPGPAASRSICSIGPAGLTTTHPILGRRSASCLREKPILFP